MTAEPGYSIRAATASDAVIIARHRVAMFREMGRVPSDELAADLLAASAPPLAALLQEGAYVGFLALDPDREIVAGAGAHIRPQLPRIASDRTRIAIAAPLLVNVYTEPSWRHRGIARALVLRLLRWAAEAGFDQTLLHASEAGRALYDSLGFTATNEMWRPAHLPVPGDGH